MRRGDIEFRYSKTNEKHELIRWLGVGDKPTCIVIAFFDKGKEGYDMRTVGERFFQDNNAWTVGKHALTFLNAVFELEAE